MASFYERYWKVKKENTLIDFNWKWPVVKKYIPTDKNNILDFGCGAGEIIKATAKISKNSIFTGVDVSKDALRRAKERFPKSVHLYQVDDGLKLPFKNNSFDFITALDVIEHVYDTDNTFDELGRVLKMGGKILITTPFNGSIKIILFILMGFFDKYFDPIGPHIRFFNPKSLSMILEKRNFEIVNKGYFGRFYPLSRGFYILAKKLG